MIRSENRQHFERTHADELVVTAELTGSLLAASARTHGLTGVISDLLTHPEGQELYRVPVPPELTGQSVRHALEDLKDVHDSLLVGVFHGRELHAQPAWYHRAPPATTSCSWSAPGPSRHDPVARRGAPRRAHARVAAPCERAGVVVVVGAGMAGLVAASELLRVGTIRSCWRRNSASAGRVLTLREPFAPGLWAEAGAMRIPRSHVLTQALIDRYQLATRPFTMDNAEAYCFFSGQLVRHRELAGDPNALGFETAAHERVPPSQLWSAELCPFAARVQEHGDDAWQEIATECDQYCVRESWSCAAGRRAPSRCSACCSTRRP